LSGASLKRDKASNFEKHLDFLTSVPQRRTQEIILASCAKGANGKMTDYATAFPTHRTTYGHFLSKGKWDDEKVAHTQQRESFQTITELAVSEQEPIFISIADTVIAKMKPSSKAKQPTDGTGWHYSHLERKIVYGYQVHAVIVSAGETALYYSLKRYSKENGTKVEMTSGHTPIPAGFQAGMIFKLCKGIWEIIAKNVKRLVLANKQ